MPEGRRPGQMQHSNDETLGLAQRIVKEAENEAFDGDICLSCYLTDIMAIMLALLEARGMCPDEVLMTVKETADDINITMVTQH